MNERLRLTSESPHFLFLSWNLVTVLWEFLMLWFPKSRNDRQGASIPKESPGMPGEQLHDSWQMKWETHAKNSVTGLQNKGVEQLSLKCFPGSKWWFLKNHLYYTEITNRMPVYQVIKLSKIVTQLKRGKHGLV